MLTDIVRALPSESSQNASTVFQDAGGTARRLRRRKWAAVVLLAAALILGGSGLARAVEVNTDTRTALRQQIMNNTPVPDVNPANGDKAITFTGSGTVQYAPTSSNGSLYWNGGGHDLSLDGVLSNGASLKIQYEIATSAKPNRLLSIANAKDVTLSNLVLDGRAADGNASTFSHLNPAGSYGVAAVQAVLGKLELSNFTLQHTNNVSVDGGSSASLGVGGGLYVSGTGGGSSFYITGGANFTENQATQKGYDAVNNSDSNAFSALGGGAHVSAFPTVEITGTATEKVTFDSNTATSDGGGYAGGGALYIGDTENQNTKVSITYTEFLNNTAQRVFPGTPDSADNINVRGGGLYIVEDNTGPTPSDPANALTLTVSDSSFTGNTAQVVVGGVGASTAAGGAMAILATSNGKVESALIDNTEFTGNTAENKASGTASYAQGGAIWMNLETPVNEKITVKDSTFTGNSAVSTNGTAQGGAIWTNKDIEVRAVVNNVTFSGNKVVNNGVETRNSIMLAEGATATFDAAPLRTITDADGIAGANGFVVKNGAGTLHLNGLNTYGGNTTINAGTVSVGGTLDSNADTAGYDYHGAIANDGALIFKNNNQTENQILSGVVSGSGTLTQNGTNTLTLAGNNTYTGGTNVGEGATLNVTGTLGDTYNGTTITTHDGDYAGGIVNDGALTFNQISNQTLSGGISGSGSLTKDGVGTLTITGTMDSDNNSVTGNNYAGDINNNSYLTFAQTGSQTLSGAVANNNNGTLTIKGGPVTLDSNSSLSLSGSGKIDVQSDLDISETTLDVDHASATLFTVNSAPGTATPATLTVSEKQLNDVSSTPGDVAVRVGNDGGTLVVTYDSAAKEAAGDDGGAWLDVRALHKADATDPTTEGIYLGEGGSVTSKDEVSGEPSEITLKLAPSGDSTLDIGQGAIYADILNARQSDADGTDPATLKLTVASGTLSAQSGLNVLDKNRNTGPTLVISDNASDIGSLELGQTGKNDAGVINGNVSVENTGKMNVNGGDWSLKEGSGSTINIASSTSGSDALTIANGATLDVSNGALVSSSAGGNIVLDDKAELVTTAASMQDNSGKTLVDVLDGNGYDGQIVTASNNGGTISLKDLGADPLTTTQLGDLKENLLGASDSANMIDLNQARVDVNLVAGAVDRRIDYDTVNQTIADNNLGNFKNYDSGENTGDIIVKDVPEPAASVNVGLEKAAGVELTVGATTLKNGNNNLTLTGSYNPNKNDAEILAHDNEGYSLLVAKEVDPTTHVGEAGNLSIGAGQVTLQSDPAVELGSRVADVTLRNDGGDSQLNVSGFTAANGQVSPSKVTTGDITTEIADKGIIKVTDGSILFAGDIGATEKLQNVEVVNGSSLVLFNPDPAASEKIVNDVKTLSSNSTVVNPANAEKVYSDLQQVFTDLETYGKNLNSHNITLDNKSTLIANSIIADQLSAMNSAVGATKISTTGFTAENESIIIAHQMDVSGETKVKNSTLAIIPKDANLHEILYTQNPTPSAFGATSAFNGHTLFEDSTVAIMNAKFNDDVNINQGTHAIIVNMQGSAGHTIAVGTTQDTKASTLQVRTLALNSGNLIVDPSWAADGPNKVGIGNFNNGTNVIDGGVGVGQNSMLTLGTPDLTWLADQVNQVTNGKGLTQNGVQAALGIYNPMRLGYSAGTGYSLIVDGGMNYNALNTALNDAFNSNSPTITFAGNSLLVVRGDAALGANEALSATAATQATVYNGAKLRIADAQINQTYIVLGDNINLDAAAYAASTGWNGSNLSTQSRSIVLTRAAGHDGWFEAKFNSAKNWLPDLDDQLVHIVDNMYLVNGRENMDANAAGVRFLSRATAWDATRNIGLGNDPKSATITIESAARFAQLGAVAPMTLAANNAAGGAITQRTSLAQPHSGLRAVRADGTLESPGAHKLGLALWAIPLYQSANGHEIKAGDTFKQDYSGGLGGVAVGADYTVANTARFGVTAHMGGGYASGGGDLAETTNHFNFWGLGAYAGMTARNFGLTADLTYTSVWNNVKQELSRGMAMRDLKSDIQSHAVSAGLRAEYKIVTPVVDVIPHAGARYTNLVTDAHSVKSDSTVLKADRVSQNIWTFPVGVAISKPISTGNGWRVKPSLDLAVIPAAGDLENKTKVRFTGTDGKAEMENRVMDYVSYMGGVGLEFGNDTVSFGLNYNLIASEHNTNHALFGTFRVEF
ncbi:MAG: autotransporter domain-containing protein [Desulfovibrio sp.]|jgi:autotransporter-associated beta strand protein|nr:autotransporter domain-containing protein [Desulfovibrio sp.]